MNRLKDTFPEGCPVCQFVRSQVIESATDVAAEICGDVGVAESGGVEARQSLVLVGSEL